MTTNEIPLPPIHSGASVLVAEDNQAMRELLKEELQDAGYTVKAAANGSSALETLRMFPADVVITDLRMPQVDGFDLIRDIMAGQTPPHIIMITAFGSIESAIKAVKLGAYDYLTKPFEIEQLLLIVHKALSERELRKKVERLQAEVEQRFHFDNIVAHSQPMREVLTLVSRIANSTATVLVTGESGTGKELIARAIHYNSPRADQPFIAVNLAALPETLIEGELFGHKRGAFTDARSDRKGLFSEANQGTIFLDEIGELAPSLQAKLLRVLQEQEIRPIGASNWESVDVRVVAATNRDLTAMLKEGTFREDLYYRLNVIHIPLPPLRNRPGDIVPLTKYFLAQAGAQQTPPRSLSISQKAQKALLAYPWPGNIRELQNILERGTALCQSDTIEIEDLPTEITSQRSTGFLTAAAERGLSLAQLEQEYIEQVLQQEGGNKTRAAQRLGLDRKTLYRKLDEYARMRTP